MAVLSRTKAAVLPEGGLHHAAAALGLKCIVIYGGFISPDQTGYDLHINLFTGGTPCGSRKSCQHCKDAMAKIEPAQVFEHLKTLL
jgi:ADP-heptose:LPS heptosyltransferase